MKSSWRAISAVVFSRERRAWSATYSCAPPGTIWFSWSFQVRRKASPMFLLAAPLHWTTMPWRMWAMRFTKSMTSSCRHSVVSVKFLMSQKPNMLCIFTPSPSRLMPLESDLLRFLAMISAPASPKPTRMRPAILVMVCRMRVVSMPSFLLLMSALDTDLNSFCSGLSDISLTSSIMISIGLSTRFVTSAVKSMVMVPSSTMTQDVRRVEYVEL
mmetsp:Transcript_10618/g.21526  ORF Transcript_10618/g.21526 Transcript_10618/m.21526 type:complete len:214 (-) Transcript_10618:747-1388(-)